MDKTRNNDIEERFERLSDCKTERQRFNHQKIIVMEFKDGHSKRKIGMSELEDRTNGLEKY